MPEFSVKPDRLRGTAENVWKTQAALRGMTGDIRQILLSLRELSGVEADIDRLRQCAGRLEDTAGSLGRMVGALEQIASLYEKSEADLAGGLGLFPAQAAARHGLPAAGAPPSWEENRPAGSLAGYQAALRPMLGADVTGRFKRQGGEK